ncbi:hypothetical protein PLESTB_001241000 [Pleodorina starrii]|uniref:Centrosomal protein of 44 kDa n=1 Tax=Pleodorina starrii TaxID=330485 RepID=A0A9W6BTA5_9CHLO|nr:hypothetical protein PLESTB_001241000 [Pleodorina starrii]
MSTGDLNGNLQRLLRELRAIKCPADVDELAGKTDQRFVESCFKLFRDVLNVRTVLTPVQFFEQGYAERKVLLLCDVIAVCKKLHNDEVRQERLAALKATRQIIRNDDIEIQQVLAPQHLPNASDGSQSVYKTKKVVATARSPSPSPGVQPTGGKAPHRQQSSPTAPSSSSKGLSQELTFRPGPPANTGHVAALRQAPGRPAAVPPPPIHTWFMNPAFGEGDEALSDLELGPGVSMGAAGRLDSSAWWRPAPSPDQQAAPAWWQAGASQGAGAARPDVAGGGATGATENGRHLFYGRPPAAASTGATGTQVNMRPAASQQPRQQPAQQPEFMSMHQSQNTQATAAMMPKGGAAGRAAQGSSHALPSRDLDEWSFSNFFGPGKAAPRRRAGPSNGDDDTDDSSQHAGDTDDSHTARTQGGDSVARAVDNLERDGPASDQDRRFAGVRPSASRPMASHAAAAVPRAAEPSPTRQQQRPAAASPNAAAAAAAAGTNPVGRSTGGGIEVDWQAKLAKLERETQEQVQQLQDKLAATEQELEKTRSEARQSREALHARVTVLEGRVRFLECELELCVKRAPGQSPPSAGSPGRGGGHAASPPAPGALAAEPSLAWNSPGRPRSAGSSGHQPAAWSRTTAAAGGSAAATSSHLDRRDHGATADTARARPNSAAAAAPGFTASGFGHMAPGGEVGLRRDALTAAPAIPSAGGGAAYSQHSSYGAAGRLATQEPIAVPAAARPTSLHGAGGTAARATPSFSPMPQPSFSFQPSSLMQQVASAAAPPPATQQQLPPPPHQQGPPSVEAGFSASVNNSYRRGARVNGASLDSAPTSARYAMASTENSQSGVYPESGSARAGYVSSSLDARLQRPAFSGASDSATVAAGGDAGSAVDAWRGAERFAPRGDVPTSILDRAATAASAREVGLGSGIASGQPRHGDGRGLLAGPNLAVGANSGQRHHHHGVAAAPLENPTTLAHAPAYAHQPGPAMLHGTEGAGGRIPHQVAPPSAGGSGPGVGGALGSGVPGTGAVGSDGASRNTDDLINSLYLRYTEANDLIQTLRKR